jgi:G3E family GTPase
MAFPQDPINDGRLPLTLLSGFLGSGKTTLLKHILRNKQNFRVCVIVNDMASLNIDASLIKNTKLVQTEERLIELSSGCICCTLRDDLLTEVGALARSGKFDYLVIESTGIGEPMQVAETFTMELDDEEHGVVELSKIARLDTCVTVVDAAELLSNAASVESLAQRGEAATEEDDRNVADLLLDQLEFADVILLNKTDLVSPQHVIQLTSFIKTLNPDAEIIPTCHSEVDITKVIHTKKFSMERAARSAGWLQSMQAETPHTPETIEYGIGCFIYRARKPFHPERLHKFMTDHFLLQEPDWNDAIADENGAESFEDEEQRIELLIDGARESAEVAAKAAQEVADALKQLELEESSTNSISQGYAPLVAAAAAAATAAVAASSSVALLISQISEKKQQQKQENNATNAKHFHDHSGHEHNHQTRAPIPATPMSSEDVAAASARRQRLHSSFGQVLRAKGFAWLASRPDLCGEWSQAGGVLRFTVGGPWYAALPAEAWPEDKAQREDILKDFQGEDGDRRQELVFIGIDFNQQALTEALDACLVQEGEDGDGGAVNFVDPFATWPSLQQILDGGDENDDDDEIRDDETSSDEDLLDNKEQETNYDSALPPAGKVLNIEEGAAELQAMLNAIPPSSLSIVQWHADWVNESVDACYALEKLAKEHPNVILARVAVESTYANRTLSLEKMTERAQVRRKDARPVLKHGNRFPAFSVHYAPSLQPAELLTGETALERATEMTSTAAAEVEQDPRTYELNNRDLLSHGGTIKKSKGNGAATTVQELTTGAAQFKSLLLAAKEAGTACIVIWSASSSSSGSGGRVSQERHHSMQNAAAKAALLGRAAIVVGDVAASNANAVLADALGVKVLPAIHIYRGMKLEKKIFGELATDMAVLEAAQGAELDISGAEGDVAAVGASSTAAAPAAATKKVAFHHLKGSNTTGNNKSSNKSSNKQRAPSDFDPPGGKFSRPGATKKMADGRPGVFFPKMPCLRCGCPWWSSDDWNATCLRCSWDCEKQGYDDDSKPLPAFVKKWEMFTAAIKDGKTAEWGGGGGGK